MFYIIGSIFLKYYRLKYFLTLDNTTNANAQISMILRSSDLSQNTQIA